MAKLSKEEIEHRAKFGSLMMTELLTSGGTDPELVPGIVARAEKRWRRKARRGAFTSLKDVDFSPAN